MQYLQNKSNHTATNKTEHIMTFIIISLPVEFYLTDDLLEYIFTVFVLHHRVV